MEKLLDRAPVIGAAIATTAAGATVVYLLGLGTVCRIPILSFCDLSDYARLSVAWLAPIVFVGVLVTLVATGGGKHWELVAFAPLVLLVFLVAIIRPERLQTTASTSSLVTFFFMLFAVLAIGLLVTRALRAESVRRDLVYALGCAALILVFALCWGVVTGLSIIALTRPTIAVHLSNSPVPLTAIHVVQLHDELVVRVLPSGKWLAIPKSRIELIEQIP